MPECDRHFFRWETKRKGHSHSAWSSKSTDHSLPYEKHSKELDEKVPEAQTF